MFREPSFPIFLVAGIGVTIFVIACIQTYLYEFGTRNQRGRVTNNTVNSSLERITCMGVVVMVVLFIALFGILCVEFYTLMRRIGE